MNRLPRSLKPLQGESIAGFLLRLAHRLDLSPGQLAVHTGLTAPGRSPHKRVPVSYMVDIDQPAKVRFAQATEIAPAELDAMLLASLAHRYAPMARNLLDGQLQHPRHIAAAEPWLLKTSTRFCPRCLAGDGITIQQGHGGPWKLSWRLPIVFACLKHRRFLDHLCPRCHTPAHQSLHPRDLVPHMGQSDLHPAQCRATRASGSSCTARLDPPSYPGEAPSAALLTLQHKLMSVLQPELRANSAFRSLGQDTDHIGYLTDLQATAALVSGSWPAAIALCHGELRGPADSHLSRRRNWISERRKVKSRPLEIVLHTQLPLAAKTCAAILAIADGLLSNPDIRTAERQLAHLAGMATLQLPWARHITSGDYLGTQAFQQAMHSTTSRLIPVSKPRYSSPTRRRNPDPSGPRHRPALRPSATFSARHIPPMAPEHWYHEHFAWLGIPCTRAARQWISIHLTQLVTGGTLEDACIKLDLSQYVLQYPRTPQGNWLRSRDTVTKFGQALHEVADELDAATGHIDYRHRRRALARWELAAVDWDEMARHLPRHHTNKTNHSRYRVKRQAASLLIWTEITQCNPTNAPILPPHGDPLRQHIVDWLRQPVLSPTRAAVQSLAIAYARSLAAQIDRTAPETG